VFKVGDKVRVINVDQYDTNICFDLNEIGIVNKINDYSKCLWIENGEVFLDFHEVELVEDESKFKVGDKVELRDGDILEIIAIVAENLYKGIRLENEDQIRIFADTIIKELVVATPVPTPNTKLPELKEFTKYDSVKSRVDLIRPEFLMGVGRILEYGSRKYSAENWAKCDDYNRYYAAVLRHLLQWKSGEVLDDETNENHLLHAACSLMFLYCLSKEKK